MLTNGLKLFHECLDNPETLVDGFYTHDELVIPISPVHQATEAMQTWCMVLERITAAKVAIDDKNKKELSAHIVQLDKLLMSRDYANFLEFTAFFPVMDVSFSMYRKLAAKDRYRFLRVILKHYLEKRHQVYSAHGYIITTVQVRKDFEKHKVQGNFGNKKARKMFDAAGYRESNSLLGKRKRFCIVSSAQNQKVLREMEQIGASWYSHWSSHHEGKRADVVFIDRNGRWFIGEMKHLKEGGGGQDKQVNELITFIDNRSHQHHGEKVNYVAFLDGVYFNKFISPATGTKTAKQRERIEECLSEGINNFFVNTHGLAALLR